MKVGLLSGLFVPKKQQRQQQGQQQRRLVSTTTITRTLMSVFVLCTLSKRFYTKNTCPTIFRSVHAWTVQTHTNNNKNNSSFQSAVVRSAATHRSMTFRSSGSSSSGSGDGDAVTTSATDATSTTTTKTTTTDALASIRDALTNSWIKQLSAETVDNLAASYARMGIIIDNDNDKETAVVANRTKRPVLNGHYVLVQPTGLRQPTRLLLTSVDVAQNWLGMTMEQVHSPDLVQWVSGNLPQMGPSWATPYALSIMGTRYTHNCPFGDGTGYGDGRAISIGEFNGYELQLKGAGKTPFCRGADGRAVLRSSIREFLGSEAMHYLGVDTTRALSLVVSETETTQRPWYAEGTQLQIPTADDPRLAQYTPAQRIQILQSVRQQKADPNIMITENCAITCRVAPSFVRVGHVDLFARRAERASQVNEKERFDTTTAEWKELQDMIWHACYREYRDSAYDPYIAKKDLTSASKVLLEESAHRLAAMVAGWVRVGFAQGNFNADNCLVSGRTMDYGPFGWMEEYHPLFAKWTGSGEHFGFLNQPGAGLANYIVLVESVAPILAAAAGDDSLDKVVEHYTTMAQPIFQEAVDQVFRVKMGFEAEYEVADALWESLEPLFRKSRVDWTLFWRQLTYVMRDFSDMESTEFRAMLDTLWGDDEKRDGSSPLYEALSVEGQQEWLAWIEQWRTALSAAGESPSAVYERMRTNNPKYVLREWMLVQAYQAAAKDEQADLYDLYNLIQRPYDEGSESETSQYYRRAPDEALTTGGTAFMS